MPALTERKRGGRSSTRLRLRRGLILVAILLVAVYSYMLERAGGLDSLREAGATIGDNPGVLFLPIVATLLSYLSMALSYDGIARAAGAIVPVREMIRITFIANTANYVLPSGGLSGFALRLVFFRRRGVSTGRSIAISFTQTLITNLMLMAFIVFGMLNLFLNHDTGGVMLVAAMALTVGLTVVVVMSLAMVYHAGVRQRVLVWLARVTDRILQITGYHGRFAERSNVAIAHLREGMELFAEKPASMITPSIWIFFDWLFMIGVLYSGFVAVGEPVSFSIVTIAFSISMVTAIASFVPGGAGVLDGALALTFDQLGVPLAISLLPILLYRVAYFVLPALLSLLFAKGAFTDQETEEAEATF